MALDPNKKAFVMHVSTIIVEPMIIHLAHKAQIASLKADKVPITIPTKYLDFINVFSEKFAIKLPEYTKINTHAINLEKDKQPTYWPIYILEPVELETLKTYIKTNLANDFIRRSKCPTDAQILFDQKPNGIHWLFVNYPDFNDLIIKNQYPLSLIRESLDWLGRAKHFIQLDLTSTYYRMMIMKGDK